MIYLDVRCIVTLRVCELIGRGRSYWFKKKRKRGGPVSKARK